MAFRLSISEIIAQLPEMTKTEDKVAWLQKHDSMPLRMILQATYDKERVEWLVPNTAPPWKKNEFEDQAKNLLYTEARRLKIFIKGGGYDDLKQAKREQLFISLLEDIDNDDADLLAHNSIAQKPFKGLQKKTINKAFPGLIKE
jgi:hypothetical protein